MKQGKPCLLQYSAEMYNQLYVRIVHGMPDADADSSPKLVLVYVELRQLTHRIAYA